MSDKIKTLPSSERPYEKFLSMGVQSLSDAELLAIILKNGTKDYNSIDIAKRLLTGGQGNLLNLYDLSFSQLLKIPGIGKVKAIQLKSIAELSRRIARTDSGYKITLDSPASIADYYMESMRHCKQEQVVCAYFDAKGKLLGDHMISMGTANSSYVAIGTILKHALIMEALKIVLIHNHPSGEPSPSNDDIDVTEKLIESAALLGVTLCDHIIIGDNRYYSFFERRLI